MEDRYPDGTIIRWISSEKYTYGALKTPVGWYSTSASRGGVVTSQVPQIMSFETLVGILSHKASSQVEVAVAWEPVFPDLQELI